MNKNTRREQTDQIRESSRAGSLVDLPLTTHVLCIVKRAPGWLCGHRPGLRGVSFTLIWTFPGASCLTFSEPIPQRLFAYLWPFLVFSLGFSGGGHFPSPPSSGNVIWGPISLMNELCRGRISHLQSFLNRQLLILDIFLIFWTFPGLVSGLHLPVSSSSPSAFKTGFSSYSATSCSSQRGALPCPLLPLFGKLAELQRTSWTFLGQWQWMCFWM
jgi:hypothetical protein